MPTEPREYRIVRNLQAALAAMTVAGGYFYDVTSTVVKLDPDHDVAALKRPDVPRPFLILDVAKEKWIYEPANELKLVLPVMVHWIGESDPTVDEARMLMFYRACADVEQAIAIDLSRGGLATDTRITGRQLVENVEGPEVWAQIQTEIQLRRTFGQPNG